MSVDTHSTTREVERAILVAVDQPSMRLPVDESLSELAQLADTAGLQVVGRAVQALKRVHPATFVGQGKVEEVKSAVAEMGAHVVVFDDPLSPAQQRNLEKAFGCKVVDRSALILDIFAQRARSLEGKMQVELAQLQYLLPRLTRAWTHLSRIRGGVGTRGPGETQLEVDRRRIRERVAQLRQRLQDVSRTRRLHRDERRTVPFPTIALVGYTNAGKSTLMNALTHAGVLVEDRLFATLDPTVRRLRLPHGQTVLVADTVGFIHKLPHQLVEAFKGTLEEVRSADLLLHLVDVANPSWPEHVRVVEDVLDEIGAQGRPRLLVLNKSDLLPAGVRAVPPGAAGIAIAARTGEGFPAFLEAIEVRLSAGLERVRCEVPPERGDILAWLRRTGRILEEYWRDGAVTVTALVPPKIAGQLRKRLAPAVVGPC